MGPLRSLPPCRESPHLSTFWSASALPGWCRGGSNWKEKGMRARSSPFVGLVTLSLGIAAVGTVSCQTADKAPVDEDLTSAQGSSGSSGGGDTAGGSGGLRPLSTV